MRFKFTLKDKIGQLPKNSGVYAFKNSREFLYIGKATNIKERVKNHFPSRSEIKEASLFSTFAPLRAELGERRKNVLRTQQSDWRDSFFLNKVKKIGYIKTDSEITTLILEAKLIKKYRPKYNVVWRDDKNYFYVAVTKDDYPRIFITHQPQPKLKVKNRASITELFKEARWKKRAKPSLPYGSEGEEEDEVIFAFQKSRVDYIGPFVDGKALKQTLKILRKIFPYRSCHNLPKRPCLWYELRRCPAPCLLRSTLAEKIPLALSSSKNVRSSLPFAAAREMKKECKNNAQNIIKIFKEGKSQTLKELGKEMKKASVFQDFEKAAKIRDQIRALERTLAHAKIFELSFPSESNWFLVQKNLKELLKIRGKISRIEAYDISNIQGQEATGSLVTFINGEANKNFYRKFKIRISGKPNDVAMIREVLSRRLKHLEWSYPDLILIDGGKAQLNAVRQCLITVTKRVKRLPGVIALAKKENKLYIEGQKIPVLLKNLPREVFNLILRTRDEAHRFAISYHKKLRQKKFLAL